MKKEFKSFALLLPIANLLFGAVVFLIPALSIFFHFKRLAHGSAGVSITLGNLQMIVPSNRFLFVALDFAGRAAEHSIVVANAPAKFVDAGISWLVSRTPRFGPGWILISTWICVTYPVYAILPWYYVGRGVDAFVGRRSVGRGNMIASLVLSLALFAFCLSFRFGMSADERQGQDLLNWMIQGLALWAVLFAVPFVAWIRQKFGRTPDRKSVRVSPFT